VRFLQEGHNASRHMLFSIVKKSKIMIIDSAEVGREIYEQQYDSVSRFISYQHQLKTIRELEPESILEIGIGSGFL
jgi:hypothetical protein